MARNTDFEELLNQVRLVHNRIVEVGEALHWDAPVTLGMRAVMEFLLKNGPATVPGIARSRSVTRQHIQVLVNNLLDEKLVKLEENPAHKRSSLVALTPAGERVIRSMIKRERRFFDSLDFGVKPAELKAAAATLAKVHETLAD